jgi:hypothetical protein
MRLSTTWRPVLRGSKQKGGAVVSTVDGYVRPILVGAAKKRERQKRIQGYRMERSGLVQAGVSELLTIPPMFDRRGK